MNKRLVPLFVSLMLLALSLVSPARAHSLNTDVQKFGEGGEFTLLIVADTQDDVSPEKAMLHLLGSSLDSAKPDLVIFLGDMIQGPMVRSEKAAAKAIDAIISPLVDRSIPFAYVYGNHDDEGGVSKECMNAIYQSYEGCLVTNDALSENGDMVITLFDKTGENAVLDLFLIDSGTYDTTGKSKYDWVNADQMSWYRDVVEAHRDEYGETLPAYIFQHIPVYETYQLLLPAEKSDENAIEGQCSWEGSYFVQNDSLVTSGRFGETPCPPDFNGGELDALCEVGNVSAMFFGHDHSNDWTATLNGIKMAATPGAGFLIYGAEEHHGTRVVTISENDPTDFETHMLYWSDVTDEPLPGALTSSIGALVRDLILIMVLLFLIVATSVVLIVARILRKRREKRAKA